MNWIYKQKLSATEAICYNGRPYIELDDLQQALHQLFNSAHNHQINIDVLDKIQSKLILKWHLFSKKEFKTTISKCNNLLASGPDKISQRLLKKIINDKFCLNSIINITNAYINLEHWLLYFKTLTLIIILKLNKSLYNSPKSFHPIVLLNMLGKLIEKIIGKRLQFYSISNNFVHPYQSCWR